jgi:hypothetical protein
LHRAEMCQINEFALRKELIVSCCLFSGCLAKAVALLLKFGADADNLYQTTKCYEVRLSSLFPCTWHFS